MTDTPEDELRLAWLTDKEAAALLGCSVSTAKRWKCGFCDQDALMIARGLCGAIYEKCNTTERVVDFVKRRAKRAEV